MNREEPLGRSTSCMPSIIKNDPRWFADPHRKPYTTQVRLEWHR